MKKILLTLVLIGLFYPVAHALQPVRDVPMHNVILQEGMTVKMAIVLGATARRWTVAEENEDVIVARLYTRGHEVTVRIPYTDKGYAIEYLDSRNMHYNAKKHKIHKKYNRWVAMLDATISKKALDSGYNLPKKESAKEEKSSMQATFTPQPADSNK